jgi:hypothetical protein
MANLLINWAKFWAKKLWKAKSNIKKDMEWQDAMV